MEVFDEDIQGRKSSSGSSIDNDENKAEPVTETPTMKSTTQLATATTTQSSVKEDKNMQEYPDIAMSDPSSEYQ